MEIIKQLRYQATLKKISNATASWRETLLLKKQRWSQESKKISSIISGCKKCETHASISSLITTCEWEQQS